MLATGISGEKNPDIIPDLRDASLNHAELICADLNRADLTGANLYGAEMCNANLSDASLKDAVLTHANLDGAFLLRTDLTGADLEHASLEDAAMIGANLDSTNLVDARFSDAKMGSVNLSGADLRGATLSYVGGLETAHCDRPALINAATVIRAYGLSELVLRALKLTNSEINLYTMTKAMTDYVEITFTRRTWAQLFPIEKALAVTVDSDEYAIEKHSDRIIIRLDTPSHFGEVLDAALPMMAGLETVSPGEVKSLTVSPVDGEDETICGEELEQVVSLVATQDLLEKGKSDELSTSKKALVKLGESSPVLGPLIGFSLEEAMKKDIVGILYTKFSEWFNLTKGLNDLKRIGSPKRKRRKTSSKVKKRKRQK